MVSIPRIALPQKPLPLIILFLLLAGALAPFLVARIPGLTDLPNHMARHHVFYHFGEGSPLDRYFDVHWRWIGNLGIDLPVLGLMHWMDAEMATRIAVACIAPLMVIALLALSRTAHGRVSASAMLAMPLVFHHAYLYGFANFSLSVALSLLAFAFWLARPPENVRGWLLHAAIAIGVWTAHMGGWSILVVAAGFAELVRLRSRRGILAAACRLSALAMPLVPLLLWRSHEGTGPLYAWTETNIFWAKALNFILMMRGWERIPDLLVTLCLGLLGIAALCWAGRRRVDDRLFAAGAGVCLMAICLPTTMLGSWGADFRVAPIGVILLLLSISPARDPGREKILFAIGLALFLFRSIGISISWHRQSAILENRLRLLDDVPYGSRLGFLTVQSDCINSWTLNPNHKLASYAIIRKDAFVNTMFKVDGADLMTVRDPHDRAKWFDPSNVVAAACPHTGIDQTALRERMTEMARDHFDRIWIEGVPVGQLSLPEGYRVIRSTAGDVLIGRSSRP